VNRNEDSTTVATRLLRLLALYRTVVGIALASIAYGASAPTAALAAAAAYSGVSALNFALIGQLRAHLPTLLLILLGVDLGFVMMILVASAATPVATTAYLLPIIAAHGYLLRSRTAFAHAAFATIVLLITEAATRPLSTASLFTAAVVGTGFFLVAAIGRLLGRNLSDAEALAEARSDAIRRLAHVNELVINELDSGVLLVASTGRIVIANPQARRWLAGDDAILLADRSLGELSPSLQAEWQRFLADPGSWDGQPLALERANVSVLPRMAPVALDTEADTLIILEDVTLIDLQAQQMKLAALGRLSASIAHEIRNPLSAIKQAAQLLGENADFGDDVRTLTRMIDKNTERIDRIVRDVSLLGRRDRGQPQPVVLGERLRELVHETAGMIGATADGVLFEPGPTPRIMVDWGHLEEMLVNLIGNAWRHSRRQTGSVRVAVRTGDVPERAVIAVSDDGPGVPAEYRDKLFEPFFSGSGSTGLGLYIVRELARANGGRVRLAPSERGATFALELPLAEEVIHAPG
jgi:two-component system sensor histidine kinase PilS (NtrC family)